MARTAAQVSTLSKRKRSNVFSRKSIKKSRNGSVKKPGRVTGLSKTDYGFPDRLRTKLHYCDVVQLTASAGSPGIWQFRLNSLYDPDLTGVGHQPQWYDQLSAVYQYYQVLGAKITVTFIPNQIADTETNDKGPYIVGITHHPGTATFGSASYAALLEDPNTVTGVIVDKQGGNNAKTLSATYSPKRDLGVDASDTQTPTNSNPASVQNTSYCSIWALDMTEAVSQDVVCKVEIEYMCEFNARRPNVVS